MGKGPKVTFCERVPEIDKHFFVQFTVSFSTLSHIEDTFASHASARVRPCVPCVSRLPPVSFHRWKRLGYPVSSTLGLLAHRCRGGQRSDCVRIRDADHNAAIDAALAADVLAPAEQFRAAPSARPNVL